MDELAGLRALVRGRVQGVFFRESTRRQAERLGLTGYVRNLADGATVEVIAEGTKEKLDALLEFLKAGPPAARVDSVQTEWTAYTGRYTDFATKY